ncbi:hypothetical protein HAX54_031985, partial [Datura stramonium]|nr:hypothetical protein [Datura stramonium]
SYAKSIKGTPFFEDPFALKLSGSKNKDIRWWIRPLMALTSTFSVGPKDSFVLSNNGFQFLSPVKLLSTASSSIDPQGGGGKYPFNNAMALSLGALSVPSNDSNISCAGNKEVHEWVSEGWVFAPPHPLLLHDAEEASTSSATKPSDTNNNSSNRGSSAGFFNQDSQDKIVVAVDVDEDCFLGNFVSALNEFVAGRYSSYHSVSCIMYMNSSRYGSAQEMKLISVSMNSSRPLISRLEFVQFLDIHFGNHFALNGQSIAKSDICRSLGANVLIDDNPVCY